MTKKELVEIIYKVLRTDVDQADLDFLSKLAESELETLVACIRDRVEPSGT